MGEHGLSKGERGLAAHLVSFIKNWPGRSRQGHEDSVPDFKGFDGFIHELF